MLLAEQSGKEQKAARIPASVCVCSISVSCSMSCHIASVPGVVGRWCMKRRNGYHNMTGKSMCCSVAGLAGRKIQWSLEKLMALAFAEATLSIHLQSPSYDPISNDLMCCTMRPGSATGKVD